MADRPILFSGPMVRAILEGKKTQTRRVLRGVPAPPDPSNLAHAAKHAWPYLDAYCSETRTTLNPRGMGENWCWWTSDDRPCEQFRVGYAPGDRLWVREGWQALTFCLWVREGWQALTFGDYAPIRHPAWPCDLRYAADDAIRDVTADVRGYTWRPSLHMPRWASRLTLTVTDVRVQRLQDISEEDAEAEGVDPAWGARVAFGRLWNDINGKRDGASWDDNPWVVAMTFTAERRNIDDKTSSDERLIKAAALEPL